MSDAEKVLCLAFAALGVIALTACFAFGIGYADGVEKVYGADAIAKMTMVETYHCPNCGDTYYSEIRNYCPECGKAVGK